MIEERIAQIQGINQEAKEQAKKRWHSVAKPLLSLGKLEDVIIQIAGIKGDPDFDLKKRALVIMCGDNGIVEEGVTQTGQEVTAVVAQNFTKKAACVSIMSETAGVDLFPVDIGMVSDVDSVTIPDKKVAYGTKNFAKEHAMSRNEVEMAIQIGIDMVRELKEKGYDIVATGEMGIGNTTTSSAVASVLLKQPVEKVTGKGAGLTGTGLQRKIEVIKKAIMRHRPSSEDVIDVLTKVGGLDIAGLTGIFLGGAIYHVPVVIDGFISSVAALCAVKFAPITRAYMIGSHVSKEPAGQLLLDELFIEPFLICDMCLGEGSGAVAVLPLIDMGLQVYKRMSTFEEINIEQYKEMK